jgi:predicted ABC-type ATPase
VSTPVLHLLAGPNGAGKSTFVLEVLQPTTRLPFVNADVIAHQRWPGTESEHGYEASRAAAEERSRLMAARASFITETVFSHPSKVELVGHAVAAGYVVHLHVMLVPETLPVARVAVRVVQGGHDVPEHKIRERYTRIWPLVVAARDLADRTTFYDNTRAATPFRVVATYERGRLVGEPAWPTWTPPPLNEESP